MKNYLFIGYGFSKKKPYLIFEDISTHIRQALPIKFNTVTIEKIGQRQCIGTYDLMTFATFPCENHMALDIKHKGYYCDKCKTINGFNPAFYNAAKISPQQVMYNNTAHIVYMAYFSEKCIKVGIASKKRCLTRLLEQGARAAIILDEFTNANLARNLEKRLCSNEEIFETVSSEKKLRLLVDEKYSYERAEKTLNKYVNRYYGDSTITKVFNLSPYYMNATFESISMSCMSNVEELSISGKLVGLIGEYIIVEQEGNFFPVSVKKFISHSITYYPEEVRCRYEAEPQQLTLWDL